MFAVSADSIREMLREVLDPIVSPALFKQDTLNTHHSAFARFLREHPRKGIRLQNDESSIVWPSVRRLVETHLEDGQDILVEGVEILPEYLEKLPFKFKVVFLGNTSKHHSNAIAAQAHANTHDWMHKYTNSSIEGWAELVWAFSENIKHEAKKYNMPFVETHDDNFEAALLEAEQLLFEN